MSNKFVPFAKEHFVLKTLTTSSVAKGRPGCMGTCPCIQAFPCSNIMEYVTTGATGRYNRSACLSNGTSLKLTRFSNLGTQPAHGFHAYKCLFIYLA